MKTFCAILFCLMMATSALAADQLVEFTWDRNPESVVIGYQLYRAGEEAGPYEAVGELIPQVAEGVELLTQDIVPYIPGTVYYYVMTARSDKEESGKSNKVPVTSLTMPVLKVKVSVIVELQ